jgi:methylthioribose-1-phosphate isomerase
MDPVKTLEWRPGVVRILDQRRLPVSEVYLDCTQVEQIADAIESLAVRGAPAIGVVAALGTALAAWNARRSGSGTVRGCVERAIARLARTRPTAVNLFWALDRMRSVVERRTPSGQALAEALLAEALAIQQEDRDACARIAENGVELLHDGWTVLTHCNAGALATAGWGTALAVIYAAHKKGKNISVVADETRPLLQGARLTTWELREAGVPVTLICDDMAAWVMADGKVDCVLTGADRIAANGDVANKIGTYNLAVLAHYHELPFFAAAPVSTIDLSVRTGHGIPIEERAPDEVTVLGDQRIAPEGIAVYNPAFDVTPASLVTAIVTDRGIARAPYERSLRELAEGQGCRGATG